MNKRLPALLLLLFVTGLFSVATAQCNLNPKILPDNLILCPNTSDTLYVTKEFDSYQWFKFNKPITGATQRYLVVNAQQDAGALFRVKVTKGNCVDSSKKVLVDGYVFVLPTILTTGQPSYIDPQTGSSVFCKHDSVSLTLLSPYTTDVQWYNNGKPIAGATNATYPVTGNGSYTACGSTDICPSYRDCENIPVVIAIDKSIPSITRSGDTLLAGKGQTYQWFVNGNVIPGATSSYYLPTKKGLYTVEVLDKVNCTATSKPYLFVPNKNLLVISPNPANSFITVHFNVENAAQILVSDLYGNRRLQTVVSGTNQNIQLGALGSGTYLLRVLDRSGNVIATEKFMKK